MSQGVSISEYNYTTASIGYRLGYETSSNCWRLLLQLPQYKPIFFTRFIFDCVILSLMETGGGDGGSR